MRKKLCVLFLTMSAISAVSITGCGKKDNSEVTQAVQETEDEFAINQGVQIMENQGGSTINSGNSSNNSNSGNEADTDNNSNANKVDNRTEWEIQESENAYLDESIAVEESEEYEAYINSEEKEELVLVYDRTENGVMIFKNNSGDGVEGEPAVIDTTEYKVNVADVTEGIEELSQGDLATIITNLAIDYDTNTFLKVWEIKNLTKEMEEQAALDESRFAEEEADENWDGSEDLEGFEEDSDENIEDLEDEPVNFGE